VTERAAAALFDVELPDRLTGTAALVWFGWRWNLIGWWSV
jgi:hypothetical protein